MATLAYKLGRAFLADRLDMLLRRTTEFRIRVIPRPFDRLLMRLKGPMTGAEIGVFEGEHAEGLLRRVNIQMLYLVDPYRGYADYDQDQMDQALVKARERVAHYGDRCAFVGSYSEDAAWTMPLVDFAYIDGAHDYENVRKDIAAWWPKIKPGGILGGHDFSNGVHSDHDGVVQAVTEFSVKNSLRLQVDIPDWWIVKPNPEG